MDYKREKIMSDQPQNGKPLVDEILKDAQAKADRILKKAQGHCDELLKGLKKTK